MPIDEYDKRVIRCRMLGHEVAFEYCRRGSCDFPCRKIFDCWFEHFDIKAFMHEHYSEEDIQKILAPPQDKTVSIYEMILQAQKNAGDKPKGHEDGTA